MEQAEQIITNKVNIVNIKEDLDFIKLQLTNHIPTKFEKLGKEMKEREDRLLEVLNKRDNKFFEELKEVKKDVKTENKEQDKKINTTALKVAGIMSTVVIIGQLVFFLLK